MWNARVAARIAVEILVVHHAAKVDQRGPHGVVRNDQVQQAVVVVIEPGGGDAERVLRLDANAGTGCHVGERAVPVVVIQRIPAGGAQEQILIAIVVVIANRDSEVEIEVRPGEAGFRRHIFKGAVDSSDAAGS